MPIYISLMGGLGNQMFQYSLGRALSLKYKTDLFLDVSGYRQSYDRNYQLDNFPIHAHTIDDITDKISINSYPPLVNKVLNLFFRPPKMNLITEKKPAYDPTIQNMGDNGYFSGFWQSEKYFHEFASNIREDFSFNRQLSGKNSDTASLIMNTHSVAIHVRRGDYLLYGQFGSCSLNYYYSSIKKIEKSVQNPVYFVFTDDPEWTEKNLILSKSFLIDWNYKDPYYDLFLMSLCKHHIIANSSFSWWGAFLGEYPDQIVIAPRPWFDNPEFEEFDIYLDQWIFQEKY